MKQKLLIIFLFFPSLKIFSQTFVMGKVTGDSSVYLPNVSVMNMRTDEVATTQQDGNFIIAAKVSDELRFTRNGYERAVVRLRAEDFTKPLNITMQLSAKLIEEVEVGFRPTGNLRKDIKTLSRPTKTEKLNDYLAQNMKMPPSGPSLKNEIPEAFKIHKPGESQVPLFGITSDGKVTGIVGAVANLIPKKSNPPPISLSETARFYDRIKSGVDMKYFENVSLDEYDFETYLTYLDRNFNFSKIYSRNFNAIAINNFLRVHLADYLKVKK